MSFDLEILSNLHFLIFWQISFSMMSSCVFTTTFEYQYFSVSLKSVCSVLEKNWVNSILILFSNSIAFLMIDLFDFFCIKSEILNIFFDKWLLFFAQRAKRQRDVIWVVKDSKVFLNFSFFFFDNDFFLDAHRMQICSLVMFNVWRILFFSTAFRRRHDVFTFLISVRFCSWWNVNQWNNCKNFWINVFLKLTL
jgi:hypothetical protein